MLLVLLSLFGRLGATHGRVSGLFSVRPSVRPLVGRLLHNTFALRLEAKLERMSVGRSLRSVIFFGLLRAVRAAYTASPYACGCVLARMKRR